MGNISNIVHDIKWDDKICRSILKIMISALIRIRAIETSYEMVWAMARSAPNRAYLEFALHPEIKTTYTFIEDTHKKYKVPNVINIAGEECG